MTLTQEELERQWPEGPVMAYRATAERLAAFDPAMVCPAMLPAAQPCWDMRAAIQGLMRVEAERLDVVRRSNGISTTTWLMTSRATNTFCRIVLDGVR